MSDRTAPPPPANRLARETSPYLLLHAHNPVDWYPWGPEAIARARAEDRPIFLSVGYSTCYWCHVMERESFTDPAIAAEMNRGFVNVKVDREERPDLDEIYMLATQILTGQGGWPNSVFLTPDLEPFFAGTYFPPAERWGRPGFPTVLASMLHAWTERRADVEAQAADLAAGIRQHLEEVAAETGPLPGAELATATVGRLRDRFDGTHGGFGEAPKFPSPGNFWLLGELAGGRADVAMMLEATLGAMARGGIFDQLAGGFHRYATDREWKVPHFEKMLYDNGLLLEVYAREHGRTGDREAERIALAVARFLGLEMTAPEGGLWSAIDAETDGHEGIYYVWTRAELVAALGAEDAEFLAPILGFAGEPFFEEHHYVLHLPRPFEVVARERRMNRERLLEEVSPLLERLLEARSRRPRPATDDKILADWNGTAIAGLATAGRVLRRPDLVARATRAAEFVLGALRAGDGRLLHSYRDGGARIPAFLSDYAFLIHGLLRLDEADPDPRWRRAAVDLAAEMEQRLAAPAGGYFNAAESPDLLFRGKEVYDGALPAANPVAALGLLDLAQRTGESRFADAAEASLRAFAPLARRHPDGARALAVALARFEALAKAGAAGVEPGSTEAVDPVDPIDRPRTAAAAAGSPLAELEREARSAVEPRWTLGPASEDGWRDLALALEVRAGWHLSPLGGGAVGEALRIEGIAVELAGFEAPRAEPRAPDGPSGLAGRIELRGRIRIPAPGRGAAVRIHFQPCAGDRCLPEQRLELDLPE